MSAPRGVLLMQLGTPDAPTPAAVRRYLREFLGDPRVIDLPALPRRLLLEAVILPTRPRASAEAYAKIWSAEGSPLLVHSRALRDGLDAALGRDFAVELGMRYGQPSLGDGLRRLEERGVRDVLAVPLFPQWAEASGGSALAALFAEPAAGRLASLRALPPCFDRPGFAEAWRSLAAPRLERFRPDHVLFSYHGLPERQVRRADRDGAHCLLRPDCCERPGAALAHCYRAQCIATTRAVARALELPPQRHSSAFQSRLGRTPWIAPYTDHVLPELAASSVRRLAVLCPSFVADCLETLEEIGLRARDQWRELGGEELLLVPSLNAEPVWVETLASWVRPEWSGPQPPDAAGREASARAAASTPEASASGTPTPAR